VSRPRSPDTPSHLSPHQFRVLLGAGYDLARASIALAPRLNGATSYANIRSMTSQGTRYGQVMTRFTRACAEGSVAQAELAARELGHVSLENALRLLCVYAAVDDRSSTPPR
jgi:hypothetical protein